MNVLIDTNVLLSAALRNRLPERVVLHVAGRDEFRWIVTPEILTEYTDVLRRPKFGLDEETLKRWVELLTMRTLNVDSPPQAPDFSRDPKDAPISGRGGIGPGRFPHYGRPGPAPSQGHRRHTHHHRRRLSSEFQIS